METRSTLTVSAAVARHGGWSAPETGCSVCGEPYYTTEPCDECGEEACVLCREAGECCEWIEGERHRQLAQDVARADRRRADWHRRVIGSCLWDCRVAVAEMEVRSGRRDRHYADPEKLRASRMVTL